MKVASKLLWLVAILMGCLFDFLFWKHPLGLNYALFLLVYLLGGLGYLNARSIHPELKNLWLFIPFAFFAVVTFSRQEPLTIFLAFAITLFSVGVLAVSCTDSAWIRYGLRDYFTKFLHLIGGTISLPLDNLKKFSKVRAGLDQTVGSILQAILRGLEMALPIVACFAFLLASADAIFKQILAGLFENFTIQDAAESILRLLIVLSIAWMTAGMFLFMTAHSTGDTQRGNNSNPGKYSIGITESAIVLGSVAILFLTFVLIQFQYFFGGHTNIGVAGYTYSQYARRGFSELITVAFFSLILILGLRVITNHADGIQRRTHVILNAVIVSEVMVMLVSAYQRLMLAIDWHGFSRLRLYPRVFMVWLGILLIAVVILEILRLERYSAFAFVLAAMGFAISLTLVNVDNSIVTHNLERVKQGKNLNVPHLASLSSDAIPALVDGFHDPAMSAAQHEGIGAVLVCYLHSDGVSPGPDWRSFNSSRWRAWQALASVEPLLDEYRYNDKKWPARVRTPSNVYHLCWEEGASR